MKQKINVASLFSGMVDSKKDFKCLIRELGVSPRQPPPPTTVISDESKYSTGKLVRFRISIKKVNLFQMR